MAYALTYRGDCSRAQRKRASSLGIAFSMATSSGAMSPAEMATAKSFARMWTHQVNVLSGGAWPAGGIWDMILHCGPHARIFMASQSNNHREQKANPKSSRPLPAGLSDVDLDELARNLRSAMTILEWYARPEMYDTPARSIDGHRRIAPAMRDRGSLARQILAHLPKGRHDEPDNSA